MDENNNDMSELDRETPMSYIDRLNVQAVSILADISALLAGNLANNNALLDSRQQQDNNQDNDI